MKKGIERCESPLEVELANAFARQSRWEWRRDEDAEYEVGNWPGWWIALLAQLPVPEFPDGGGYRCDFVLSSFFPEDTQDGGTTWFVVVEVDGHEFHERTKEQAEHDRSRDRWFAKQQIHTLRFTGREVWRDPDKCAREALWFAIRIQEKRLLPKLEEFLRKKFEKGETE